MSCSNAATRTRSARRSGNPRWTPTLAANSLTRRPRPISRLFREEQDVRQLVKLKAIYELLELTTDKCQDVALVIEGVVLENG